ncbi:hypothetical protein PTSG_10670 [Salpingoeca rosetta]|uniref:Uncharacterized protein n=1 Tax=Salpingoeca rosetta (strain ATCC 50818 / BSB-021) TaxID=946362 RepID=F2UQ18_SALR5|nr:uncharacterized protein PTSG_10670 [Salpingoeca rosetta]EGD79686.1 hypothetical protein PTSG_10670 [Salpingoeca rosetta]|eukprot:XP_004988636.1 hypothetical protein PTSG_10670 [Salpingoeca rosetta]
MDDVIAGTVGGIALTLVGHPFDTVKVRLQTQPKTNPVYSSTLDCVHKTWAQEGISGFYKGVTSPLAGQMFFRATLFFSFGQSTRLLQWLREENGQRLPALHYFAAGAMTGAAAAMVESPIDLFKSQVQTDIHRKTAMRRSVLDVARECVRTNGVIRGPYQALHATLLRNIPANAVYFGCFEYGRTLGARHLNYKVDDLPVLFNFACGGIAGLMYWVTTYPTDVLKSVLMSDAIDPAQRRHPTYAAAARYIHSSFGVAGFYRGFATCCARAVIANGVIWATVIKVKSILASTAPLH